MSKILFRLLAFFYFIPFLAFPNNAISKETNDINFSSNDRFIYFEKSQKPIKNLTITNFGKKPLYIQGKIKKITNDNLEDPTLTDTKEIIITPRSTIINPNESTTFRVVYLPTTSQKENPQNKFTVENRVLYMTSGNFDDNEQTSSFSHKTLASYGKQFLLAQGNVDDENKYELQELNIGTIVDKYSVKSGFLQNRGNNFTPSLNILGMKVETEEQLFLDSDLTMGSKIEIFIPSTAKVLFYKNDLLIDYQILNYGLQEIDTTRFPQGSYNVELQSI